MIFLHSFLYLSLFLFLYYFRILFSFSFLLATLDILTSSPIAINIVIIDDPP